MLLYMLTGLIGSHLYLPYVEEPELKGRFGAAYEVHDKAAT
jgi:hypothetical protein